MILREALGVLHKSIEPLHLVLMQTLIVDLRISPDEYLKMYQGVASSVRAQARDGRSIRFPARILQPYVTREGISGSFLISFDEEMKFRAIDRL